MAYEKPVLAVLGSAAEAVTSINKPAPVTDNPHTGTASAYEADE